MALAAIAAITTFAAAAQSSNIVEKAPVLKKEAKQWYENFAIRGYIQVRYNRFLETNPKN